MKENVVKTEYGYEVTWASTDSYTGKILVFERAGVTLPLHFHKNKNKSWFVNAGKFRVQWVDTLDGKCYSKELPEGSTFHVPALMPVSLESLAPNGAVAEASDQHADSDVYRLN
jgi:uncharacterized RmlC-like cupin family protein